MTEALACSVRIRFTPTRISWLEALFYFTVADDDKLLNSTGPQECWISAHEGRPSSESHRRCTAEARDRVVGSSASQGYRNSLAAMVCRNLNHDIAEEMQTPRIRRPSKLRTRIMSLVVDGKPWRHKHLVERVAEGLKPSAVRKELELLREEGDIAQLQYGVWILAGTPAPDPKDIQPLKSKRSVSHTVQKVLARLSEPTTAPTLVEELGVTRQRVDQILKGLLEDTKVARLPDPQARGRWLWVRSGVDITTSTLLNRPPKLSPGRAKMLDALKPGEFHWMVDVAQFASLSKLGISRRVAELQAAGLAVSVRLGKRRYVAITSRGLAHAARTPLAARAAAADLTKAFGKRDLAVLEALAAAGGARTSTLPAQSLGETGTVQDTLLPSSSPNLSGAAAWNEC